MNLFENEAPPEMLYHGTTIEHLIGIFIKGTIDQSSGQDDGHDGVSFTSDIDVAKNFAHEECHDSNVLYREVSTAASRVHS